MLNKDYHRLLKRQLKKVNLNISDNPDYHKFLNLISTAYKDFDKDINRIENILEESSKEMYSLNQELRSESASTKARLKNVVDNIGGIIFETDPLGNFTFLNNAWEVYSGYSIEESLGKNYKDFLNKDTIESSVAVDKLFTRENKFIKFIFQHKNKAKDRLGWFELKSQTIYNFNNEALGFVGTITDITNLKETQIKLEKASNAKDEFLSTMSHEIRTPLNAVTGLANILLMENHLPDQQEHLKALKYSGEHLLGLINDLLDFNKIKSGKVKLVEKDFSLSYLLENLKSHFGLRAEKKGVVFNIVEENDIPKNIIGDKLKLAQIIKNLLSNSLKFTQKGSVVLKVKNLGITQNKVTLEFKVIDTGIGISKNKQDSIFDSFVQAENDTSVKYGGTGLGLSISNKLLQLQKSKLTLDSEKGRGSTFTFKISYKVSNRLNTFEPNMVKIQYEYKPLKINILVAEDNKMNVLIIERFLKKWEVNFEIADNGEKAIELIKCKSYHFDLVLMDLQMPIIDGYKATRIIRNLEDPIKAQTPIIALTAFAQTDIREKTKRYGMDDFISKPFNPSKLYKILEVYSKSNIKKHTG